MRYSRYLPSYRRGKNSARIWQRHHRVTMQARIRSVILKHPAKIRHASRVTIHPSSPRIPYSSSFPFFKFSLPSSNLLWSCIYIDSTMVTVFYEDINSTRQKGRRKIVRRWYPRLNNYRSLFFFYFPNLSSSWRCFSFSLVSSKIHDTFSLLCYCIKDIRKVSRNIRQVCCLFSIKFKAEFGDVEARLTRIILSYLNVMCALIYLDERSNRNL